MRGRGCHGAGANGIWAERQGAGRPRHGRINRLWRTWPTDGQFPCNDIFSADLGAARLLISMKDLTKKSAVVWLPTFSSTFR